MHDIVDECSNPLMLVTSFRSSAVTVMSVTLLCWWLYDGDLFEMLVAESLCWRLFSLCWRFSQCIKSVTRTFGFVFRFHFHLMANLKIIRNKLKMSFQSLKLPSKLTKSKISKNNQKFQDQKFPSRCSLVLRWHLWLTKRVSSHPARVFEIFD